MKPDDVVQNQRFGTFYRHYDTGAVPICEDCWKEIPRYVDFPNGLVSPESDGDAGGNFIKRRMASTGGGTGIPDGAVYEGWEHQQKVVCLSCYRNAFNRVYPGKPWPNLRGDYTVRYPEVFKEPENPPSR